MQHKKNGDTHLAAVTAGVPQSIQSDITVVFRLEPVLRGCEHGCVRSYTQTSENCKDRNWPVCNCSRSLSVQGLVTLVYFMGTFFPI